MNIHLSALFITVNDPDEALAFYRDALGLEVRNDVAVRRLALGHRRRAGPARASSIVLSQPHGGRSPGRRRRPPGAGRQGLAARPRSSGPTTSTPRSRRSARRAPRCSRSRSTSRGAPATAPSATRRATWSASPRNASADPGVPDHSPGLPAMPPRLAGGGSGEAGGPLADVVGQLRRVDHLEVRAHRPEGERRPVERSEVIRSRQRRSSTSSTVAHWPIARVRPSRRLDQRLDGVGRRGVLDARAYERRGVLGGQLPRAEPLARAPRPAEPVEPEAAPVVPGQVVGDQVPAAPERDQPVRLDVPLGPLAAGGGVAEPQPFLVAAGLRDRGERPGVDGRPAAAPARRARSPRAARRPGGAIVAA